MATSPGSDVQNMALFCDFENVALGVRDAKYSEFDIRKVLERLLVKGDIVVKKAYCDWERYKDFKKGMHEAAFELIEIPHVRQSGKNSADIRMVVDALDLCYTKAHVDAFVIISGDSDFSPLVSKLRENNKTVIGVGVRSSTSDLLVGNCDEFIFYDDLVKAEEARRKTAAKKQAEAAAKKAAEVNTRKQKEAAKKSNEKKAAAEEHAEASDDARRLEAIELVVDTVEALLSEKDLDEVHASNVKNALKRRRPDFVESAYGYKAFGKILEDAEKRGLLEIHRHGQAVAVCLPR
ncbi:MAG: NYN domain-containing protein [Betaproteobacteria bacterium]|nr:NYN domain-containing protein [Betaproteobacteria bacterium]